MKTRPLHSPGISTSLAAVIFAMFIWGLGEGLFIFFLPLALQKWDTSAVQIGAVLSLIGVTMAVVQVPAGYLSDCFGTRPLILAAMFLGVAAAVMMAVAQTLSFFVAGLLAYGFTSLISPPLNSYITGLRGRWSVQRTMTFVSASMQVGLIFGPTVGGWIADSAGLPVIFRYSSVLFLLSTLVIILVKRPLVQESREPAAPKVSPLTNPRFLILLGVVFFTITALSAPQQLTSMYLQNVHHLSTQQIGMMGTVASIGTAIMMVLLGNLGPSTGMLVGQLLVAGYALIMWQGQSAAVFFAGYALVGGYRLYRSMALAFSYTLVKTRDTGLAYGLVETGNALAMIVAPLAAGFLYNYQPQAVYTASLVALVITMLANRVLLGTGLPPGLRRIK